MLHRIQNEPFTNVVRSPADTDQVTDYPLPAPAAIGGGGTSKMATGANHNNNNFSFSNDEINSFNNLPHQGALILGNGSTAVVPVGTSIGGANGGSAGGSSDYRIGGGSATPGGGGGCNTGGRSTRATTPGDEQIFQESIESLQVRIGRLLSCEEMSDMHFLICSGHLLTGGSSQTSPQPGAQPSGSTPVMRKLRIPAHK